MEKLSTRSDNELGIAFIAVVVIPLIAFIILKI